MLATKFQPDVRRWLWLGVLAFAVCQPVAAQPPRAGAAAPGRDQQVAEFNKELGTARERANQAEFSQAAEHYQKAYDLCRRLWPDADFSEGTFELVDTLEGLADVSLSLGDKQAVVYGQQAVDVLRRLFPPDRYPEGHSRLVGGLRRLGAICEQQRDWERATTLYEQALEMTLRLYPADRFPQGPPSIPPILDRIGYTWLKRGDGAKARAYAAEVVERQRRLFPPERFPQGHPGIATALQRLGVREFDLRHFDQAQAPLEEALAMRRRLWPAKDAPRGHPEIVRSLLELATLRRAQGQYARARALAEEALAMSERLFPEQDDPRGHPDIADCLADLGIVLGEQNEWTRAQELHERALAMRLRLFPPEEYPTGHSAVAESLNSLAMCYLERNQLDRAADYFQQVLAMRRNLAADRSSEDQFGLLDSLMNLGAVCRRQQNYEASLDYYQRALVLSEQVYNTKAFPFGHGGLATAYNNVASCYADQGDLQRASELYERALAVDRQIYPAEIYRQGHPHLVTGLHEAGRCLLRIGEYRRAADYFLEQGAMRQRLLDDFSARASEAESFNMALRMPSGIDESMSVWPLLDRPADELYAVVWRIRGALFQTIARRQQFLLTQVDPSVREVHQRFLEARRELADAALATADTLPSAFQEREQRLRALAARAEALERELAGRVPGFAEAQASLSRSHRDLIRLLPAKAALIDFLVYRRRELGRPAAESPQYRASYAAFILLPDEKLRFVELGPIEPIDQAVAAWREAIISDQPGDQGQSLRQLVWEPIERGFATRVESIYIAPDGQLCQLPWQALPDSKPNRVLLEKYTLALVPNGPFLLDQLDHPVATQDSAGVVLAVGDVQYEAPADRSRPASERPGVRWPELPSGRAELERIRELAGPRRLLMLSGSEATAKQVAEKLPQATTAVFATHGFFATGDLASALFAGSTAAHRSADVMSSAARSSIGSRHPLLHTGLVFAGANSADETSPAGQRDQGILTGEAIAGLPLENLDLAVLSACQTGLGDVTAGEGVFGLQRAFHQAGTRNVVASLWQIDDEATAALMRLFYQKRFQEGKSPLSALREAQLAIYRHPAEIGTLARTRGPDFLHAVKSVETQPADKRSTSDVRHWAAFMLSGSGQ